MTANPLPTGIPVDALVDEVGAWCKAILSDERHPRALNWKKADLAEGIHHVVLTVWHPDLRGGRVQSFIAPDTARAKTLDARANVNLEIFRRASTLNERFLSYACSSDNRVGLCVEIQPEGPYIKWIPDGGVLSVGSELWSILRGDDSIRSAIDGYVDGIVRDQLGSGANGDKQMNSVVSVARAIRVAHGKGLRETRARALDAIVLRGELQHLLQAAGDLATEDDKAELERTGRTDVSIGLHHDILDGFLGCLQALAFYAPTACRFRALFSRLPDDKRRDCGCAVLVAYDKTDGLNGGPEPAELKLLAGFTKRIQTATQRALGKPGGGGSGNGRSTRALFMDLLATWRLDKCDEFICGLLKAAELLSSDIHEGRRCSYSFVVGDGTVWNVIDESISYEAGVPRLSVDGFVRLIRAHWSIFQQPGVAGLIELTDVLLPRRQENPGLLFLSRLVRLRTPDEGAESSSRLLRYVARGGSRTLVIRANGDGRVLVFREEKLVYVLDTKTGMECVNPDVALKGVMERALRASRIAAGSVLTLLQRVVEEVSETPGEGCLVVFSSDRELSARYMGEMDREDHRMMWRRPVRMEMLDPSMLRALLVMDGATLVTGQLEARKFVAPHVDCNSSSHSFGVTHITGRRDPADHACNEVELLIDRLSGMEKLKDLRDDLECVDGKGAKHHSAASLTLLLWNRRQDLKVQGKDASFEILTVSADGPVTCWTSRLRLAEGEALQ